MHVEQGTVYGFLGANGAGKTTIFKMLTGLLTPDSGSIEILGSDMLRNRDELLSKIGSLIESPIFYEHLSAKKNLEMQFMTYANIFRFTSAIGIILFGIFSATMYGKLVIEEYSGKRLALIFSYPISRKKIRSQSADCVFYRIDFHAVMYGDIYIGFCSHGVCCTNRIRYNDK